MAWAAQRGVPVSVRHPVRNLGGALVTGQAGALARALSDPAGAASGLTTTVVEIGATGWYLVTFTPNAAGAWVLTVTNPAPMAGDGAVWEYQVQAGEFGLPGVALGGYGLTDLATVKASLKIPTETKYDALLATLIDGVTSDLEQRAGRHFGQYAYTEESDGDELDTLWLRQGPLVSVTSVEELVYSSSGVAATVLDPWQYVARGVAVTPADDPRARVVRVDSQKFAAGRRRWRVTYTAGWANLPPSITHDATRLVVAHFRRSDLEGLITSGALELQTTPLDPAELDRLAGGIAAKWRYPEAF